MNESTRATEQNNEIQRDIVAIFFDIDNLNKTIFLLRSIGISDDQMGLLCSEESLQTKLEEYGDKLPKLNDAESEGAADLVENDSTAEAPYAAIAGLSFVATALGGGALVASAAVFGGALAAATTSAVVVSGIGVLAGSIMSKSDADALQKELDAGHILLSVRTGENRQKDEVKSLLDESSGVESRILDPGNS